MKLERDDLNRIFRYAFSLANDRDVAYDLLSDATVKLLDRDDIDDVVRFGMRCVRNKFIDLARQDRRFEHLSYDDEPTQTVAWSESELDSMLISKVDFPKLWDEVEPKDREILHLWAVESYSTSEIAALLETSRNTILSRIHRLRERMKERFPSYAEDAS